MEKIGLGVMLILFFIVLLNRCIVFMCGGSLIYRKYLLCGVNILVLVGKYVCMVDSICVWCVVRLCCSLCRNWLYVLLCR